MVPIAVTLTEVILTEVCHMHIYKITQQRCKSLAYMYTNTSTHPNIIRYPTADAEARPIEPVSKYISYCYPHSMLTLQMAKFMCCVSRRKWKQTTNVSWRAAILLLFTTAVRTSTLRHTSTLNLTAQHSYRSHTPLSSATILKCGC
jgi:hypothetical protein